MSTPNIFAAAELMHFMVTLVCLAAGINELRSCRQFNCFSFFAWGNILLISISW
jgi:hypothetical protein